MTLNNNIETLNVLHWNANGITTYSHTRQFENLLTTKNIHIAGLNETFLKEVHKPFFHNYSLYRNDRQGANGGGVAILIHKCVNHKLLPITKTRHIENLSVEIYINQRRVTVTTAYSPKFSQHFINDIKALTPINDDFILLGDLNAKHSAWNCEDNNPAGNALNDLQLLRNFFIYYPDNPTLYPHRRNSSPSTVDIVLSNLSLPMRVSVLDYEIPSDHRPIVCNISARFKHEDSRTFSYKHTNWSAFQGLIDHSISSLVDIYNSRLLIDKEIENFTQLILTARNVSTPSNIATKPNPISHDILKLIGQRKKFKRKQQRSSDNQQSCFYKQCAKFLSKFIDKKLNLDRNKKWSNLLEHMKPGDKRFWKISRSLRCKSKRRIPHLMDGSTKLIADVEKADLLANTFYKSHELTLNYSHSIDRKVNFTAANLKAEEPSISGAVFITIEEISLIVSRLKTSKAPGFDNVPNILLKKLPSKALQLLVLIFNSCIRLNYFPAAFKKAKVVAVAKPNKPANDPTSYRPISLLSNLGKLFEKLIHSRITDCTSESHIISENQFGFKKEHSTTHQIGRIKNKINLNKRLRKSTGLILLDIEKAFDTVWHNGLLYKMVAANMPKYICKIVSQFLEDREYAVSVNQSVSPFKSIPAGLPQGSILSPTLYSIYTSDFKPPKEVDTAYYADDTALITSSKLTSALLKKMELSLKACNKYFNKWKIKINNNKTHGIIFPFNKSPKRIPRRPLNFDGNIINIENEVIYLGVTLDKKLTFRKHIEYSCQKAIKAFRALWPFLNCRSTLSLKNKNLIYKCVIRPILSFASPIWYRAAKTHLKKLQVIQNKCLKMIHNKPWRFPTSLLHAETGYELFMDFVKKINVTHFQKILDSRYCKIRECREIY